MQWYIHHDYTTAEYVYLTQLICSKLARLRIGCLLNLCSDTLLYCHATMMYWLHVAHTISAGNNCLFEYNNLSGLCYEVTDSGGFYTGRSWIERGNIIRHSQFSEIRTTEKTSLGSPSVQAIYLDDQVLVPCMGYCWVTSTLLLIMSIARAWHNHHVCMHKDTHKMAFWIL